jgi:hypothetical protein
LVDGKASSIRLDFAHLGTAKRQCLQFEEQRPVGACVHGCRCTTLRFVILCNSIFRDKTSSALQKECSDALGGSLFLTSSTPFRYRYTNDLLLTFLKGAQAVFDADHRSSVCFVVDAFVDAERSPICLLDIPHLTRRREACVP